MREHARPLHRLLCACATVILAGCSEKTVTNPSLSAACSAQPASGRAPLLVAFRLDVSGAAGPFSVAIHYGDGQEGTDPDRTHEYATAGTYVAAFTVSTKSQSARCTTTVSVDPAPTPSPSPTPSPTFNRPPVGSFRTNPAADGDTITGTAPFSVAFNMCRSSDPDGDHVYYRMDLDGDGSYEEHGATGGDCRHDHVFAAGTHRPTMCLTDVDCPVWPLCEDAPRLHGFDCRTYTVVSRP